MLNRHNFQIAELAPDDPELYPLKLCGIYVTPGGTFETDGSQCVFVSAPELQQTLFDPPDGVEPAEDFTPFILPREQALKVAKGIPKTKEKDEQNCAIIDQRSEEGNEATLAMQDATWQDVLTTRKIEGKFPDISRIIPNKDASRITIALDVHRFASLLKCFARFCKSGNDPRITLRIYGQGEAGMRIDAEGVGQEMVAVIMPLRDVEADEG